LREITAIDPKAPAPYMIMGRTLAQRGDKAGALAAYRGALAAQPDFQPAQVAIMALDIADGREADAQKSAAAIAAASKGVRSANLVLAQAMLQAGKNDRAAELLRDAAKAKDLTPELAREIAAGLIVSGDLKSAADLLTAQARGTPDVPSRIALGDILLKQKDYAGAAKQYENVLAAEPRNVIALNNLAWLYGQNKDTRALAMAERANHIAGGNPAVQDTLGQLLVNGGDVERGVWLLRMARSSGVADAAGTLLFAEGLAKLNRPDEAKSALKLVLESGSAEDKAKASDLMQRLQ